MGQDREFEVLDKYIKYYIDVLAYNKWILILEASMHRQFHSLGLIYLESLPALKPLLTFEEFKNIQYF